MSKKYFLSYLLLFICNTIISQNCDLIFRGVITDFHDGTPISGAYIKVKGSELYGISDSKGSFIIKNICTSKIKAIVSHVSCESKLVSVNLSIKSFTDIQLEHHVEELTEVNITTKANKKIKTVQESFIKNETLEKFSSLSLGDVIKEIPGVSSINTGNSIVKPVINGLHGSRVLIMTNNVRLQDQEWGIEHAPNIDINSAGSVSLIKGANALEYGGDAIGGVIIVNPIRIFAKDSLFGKTIINGQSNSKGYGFNSTFTKTSNNGWYVSGQTSYKKFGDFNSPDYILTNTGSESRAFSLFTGRKEFEQGYEFYYSYLKNKIGILRSSHIGNVEDLVDGINSNQPRIIDPFSYDISAPRQEVTHQIFKGKYFKRFKELGKLDIQYDYQNNHRFEFDIRRGDDRNVAAIDLKLQSHTLKSTLQLDSKTATNFKLGVLARYQDHFANPDTGVRRLIPDYKKFDLGFHLIANFKPTDKILLDIGVRYDFNRVNAKKFYQTSRWEERDYNIDFQEIIIEDFGTQLLVNPIFDFHNLSASSGVFFELDDTNSFVFNYGLSNRAPNVSELFSDGLHHSAARIELGDLRLKKETSHRISGTYNYENSNLEFHVDGFFNYINNFIYIEPSGVETTNRGAFPVWDYKQINASLFGIDLNLNYNITKQFEYNNKSSYIKGKDLSSDRALIDIPSFKTLNIIRYSNKSWSNFNAEIESEWIFRQNEYPNNNFEAFIPRTNSYVLVDISTPPPAYHILNFRGSFDLKILKDKKVNLAFTINNLVNTPYRENLNRLRYFADEIGRNFTIQLKFNY